MRMGVTISTHNGSAVAREHNIRNRKVTDREGHIDPHGNHEIWIDEKPQAAYQRLFGEAVEEYNTRQKRSDRKITDYYCQICNDKKKHPVYEMIIAVGDRTDYVNGNLNENTAKSILREFVDGWQKRNPHLVLTGAYYHADEQGAPHAHLDYIPIANGYKRGLETQSALVKALEQQGFSKDGKETAQIQWERRENAHLEQLCLNRGIEVRHPLIEGRKHLETDLYQLKADTERVATELQQARDEVTVLRDSILAEIKPPKRLFSKKQEITEDTLNYIKRVDKRVSEVLKQTQATKQALTNALQAEERAKTREKEVTTHLQKIDAEVEQRANNKVSLKLRELEHAKIDYQTATANFKTQFSKSVAEAVKDIVETTASKPKNLAFQLADFCNKIKLKIKGEELTVWEAYVRQSNNTVFERRSIELIKQIYEISAKFEKANEQQHTKQKTKENEMQR